MDSTPTIVRPDPEMLTASPTAAAPRPYAVALYLIAGMLLGVIFVKSEVLTWYRIQEMFRFQSFHMYGIIGSALVVAAASVFALRQAGIRTLDGQAIVIPPKQMTPRGVRYWAGGTVFGLGWGLVGACPGPMFALIGAGVTTVVIALVSAVAGTWVYGAVQARIPH